MMKKIKKSVYLAYLSILIMVCFTSCAAMPSMFQAVEDIADDTAIQIKISKEAISKDAQIDAAVSVGPKK